MKSVIQKCFIELSMYPYKCALYYLCLVSVGDVFMYKCLQLFWCVCQALGGHWEL